VRRWLFRTKVVIATKVGFAYDENGDHAGLSIFFECGSSRPPLMLTSSWGRKKRATRADEGARDPFRP
jgi:hypothetical protein